MYASRTPTSFLIMDTNDDPVSRAERALYDIQELADSTAEHHPYWYYCTTVLRFPNLYWKNGMMI